MGSELRCTICGKKIRFDSNIDFGEEAVVLCMECFRKIFPFIQLPFAK